MVTHVRPSEYFYPFGSVMKRKDRNERFAIKHNHYYFFVLMIIAFFVSCRNMKMKNCIVIKLQIQTTKFTVLYSSGLHRERINNSVSEIA